MFASARRRLVVWNVLVFAVVLIVIVGFCYGAVNHGFYDTVQSQLLRRLKEQQLFASQVGVDQLARQDAVNLYAPANPGVFAVVADAWGRVSHAPAGFLALGLPDRGAIRQALAGHTDQRTVTRNGIHLLLRTVPVIQGTHVVGVIQVGRSLALHEQEMALLTQIALIGGAIGVVLALAGSFFLAERALIPVRQAFIAQRNFVADASHELRTPLAVVQGTVERLQHRYGQDPERDRERIDDLAAESAQLTRLVSDLLTLARSDVGQLALVSEPLDLAAVVADTCRRVSVMAEQRGIALTWTSGRLAMVYGDPAWLTQLVSILLDNALSYTDWGGRVQVTLETESNGATVSVADTGIGIPAEDLSRIFDRFYRVDGARARSSGGTGLGLAMAQTIAELHGGKVEVVSQVGVGSTFMIRLPLLAEPVAG
jgi:signal transduction histidine kinase